MESLKQMRKPFLADADVCWLAKAWFVGLAVCDVSEKRPVPGLKTGLNLREDNSFFVRVTLAQCHCRRSATGRSGQLTTRTSQR